VGILTGINLSGLIRPSDLPYVPPELTCEAWACDDGCAGDSNCVGCDLPPGHEGDHWDKSVGVCWRVRE
jgi:hypothetical protein